MQFGDQARQRYQALILVTANPIRRAGNRLQRAFAAITLSIHASRPNTPNGTIKSPRHIVFYRVVNDDVIEVVQLLHDAMEVQLHLPND